MKYRVSFKRSNGGHSKMHYTDWTSDARAAELILESLSVSPNYFRVNLEEEVPEPVTLDDFYARKALGAAA